MVPRTLSRPRDRSLRWPKFFVLLFFASVCAAKALPVLRVLARFAEAPLVPHPEPLLGATLASLATVAVLVWLLLDVVCDVLVPRLAVAALVLLAALPWGARERSAEEEAALLRQAARRVAAELGARWEREGRLEDLAGVDAPALYRSRWLRKQPLAIALLPAGASLPEEEEVRPGTFYVSLSDEGGWLSVGAWVGGRARLLRSEGAIDVFRIFSRDEGLRHGI